MALRYFIVLGLISTASTEYVWGVINGSAQLPCHTSHPVNWVKVSPSGFSTNVITKNDPAHMFIGKAYLSEEPTYKNLTILNLHIDDASNYRCIELAPKNSNRQPLISLIVFDPSVADTTMNATSGDSAELQCAFESPTKWAFYRKDTNTLLTLSEYDNENSLTIWEVSQANDGTYYCFKGTLSHSIRLVVELRPIEPINVVVLYIIIATLTMITLLAIIGCIIALCRRPKAPAPLIIYEL